METMDSHVEMMEEKENPNPSSPETQNTKQSQPPAQDAQNQESTTEESPAASTAAKAAALCGVCQANPPKYKCPRCYLPYCSVACNKIHRENHPPDPEPAPQPTVPTSSSAAADTTQNPQDNNGGQSKNPFSALDSSEKLKYLFRKYPSLPDQLLKIHAATLPPADNGPDSRIPASLMKGIPKRDKWNHDIGLRNGKDALRKARKAQGDEGKAIREYSELILHLLDGDQSDEANTLLQQQAADQDMELIGRLLAEEK